MEAEVPAHFSPAAWWRTLSVAMRYFYLLRRSLLPSLSFSVCFPYSTFSSRALVFLPWTAAPPAISHIVTGSRQSAARACLLLGALSSCVHLSVRLFSLRFLSLHLARLTSRFFLKGPRLCVYTCVLTSLVSAAHQVKHSAQSSASSIEPSVRILIAKEMTFMKQSM